MERLALCIVYRAAGRRTRTPAAGASHFAEDAERVSQLRAGRELLMIDIAVPRDIDPTVREVSGIRLYNIDDLEQAVAQNLDSRRAAATAGACCG